MLGHHLSHLSVLWRTAFRQKLFQYASNVHPMPTVSRIYVRSREVRIQWSRGPARDAIFTIVFFFSIHVLWFMYTSSCVSAPASFSRGDTNESVRFQQPSSSARDAIFNINRQTRAQKAVERLWMYQAICRETFPAA